MAFSMNKTEMKQATEQILERWSWLTEGLDSNETLDTAICLENAYEKMIQTGQLNEGWLEENLLNEGGAQLSGSVGTNLIPKVMFPMIRRVMPKLLANKLVSTQPIAGPTGVIYYMHYGYSDKIKTGTNKKQEFTGSPFSSLETKPGFSDIEWTDVEPGYDPYYSKKVVGPTSFDKVVSVDSVIGLFSADSITKIEVYDSAGDAVSGLVEDTDYELDLVAKTITFLSASTKVGTDTGYTLYYTYEQEASSDIPSMEFQIGSDTIETTERKLKISWTKESEQDMKSFHKIDVESELVKIASIQMNYEIDRELLDFISKSTISELSKLHSWNNDAPGTGSNPNTGGNNAEGNYLDRHRALTQKIYQTSALVAQYNRQGPASWAVVSPQMGAVLTMLPDFKGEIAGGTFNVFEAGSLGTGLQVFVDPNKYGGKGGEIQLGYKTKDTSYGAGVVYSPYTTWMSNTITDPSNFNSVRGFFSRYALKLVDRGQFHYAKVNVTGLTV